MDDILYSRLLISMHDRDDHSLIDEITRELKLVTGIGPTLTYKQE